MVHPPPLQVLRHRGLWSSQRILKAGPLPWVLRAMSFRGDDKMRILNIRCSLDSSGVIMNRLFLAAFLFVVAATASTASAQVVLSVAIAPPPLPVYTQPICPGDGYIWTPG